MIARIAPVAVLLCVVAGCTPDEPDARPSSTPPAPGTTTATTTTPSTPPPTAPPPLTRTLDPDRYATERTVCDLLTDAQAVEQGLPSPSNTYTTGGGGVISCYRKHALADRDVEYTLWLDYDVLGSAFGRVEPEKLHNRYISGQAAVVNGADPTGFCQVDLSLAARKGIEILAHDRDNRSCALAVTIAERMVVNLTGSG